MKGYFACQNCQEVGGYKDQNNFIPDIWMKRNKWFERACRKYLNSKYIHKLSSNFVRVVYTMKRNNLVRGKNRYGYYTIRLTSTTKTVVSTIACLELFIQS